ncbi:MAG TPA: hypothetical protein PKW88_06305 [Plasticicumulans sp.]|uniref:hypothetical protein n=2 Tax=Plasticicumulans sp. TaxID=2307179 RepID=UPI000F94D321|nr:MAG: hypothetical protein EKK65_15395 [Xanthomonadales bacterium]HMZ10308.1 hypothetical protein [Plasticicumulans sp.]
MICKNANFLWKAGRRIDRDAGFICKDASQRGNGTGFGGPDASFDGPGAGCDCKDMRCVCKRVPPVHAGTGFARQRMRCVCKRAGLMGGIANFKAAAAYLHPPAASRIAPAPSRAPFLHRQGSRHRRIRTICGRPGTGMDQNAGYRGKTASEARKRADKSGNSPPECPETLLFPELVHDLDHGAGHRGRHRCFGDSKMSYRIFSTEHQGQVVSREASRPTSSQPFSTQFTAPDQPQAAEYETLYNAVSVKRHLEAVGVHGLYIREVQ